MLELFAKRADRWTKERFDFGLRLPGPAQRPKQRAGSQVSSGKAVAHQKRPALEGVIEPIERQRKALFSVARSLCVDVHQQILLPLDCGGCVVRIRRCQAPIGKGLIEEVDDLRRTLDHGAVGLENRD